MPVPEGPISSAPVNSNPLLPSALNLSVDGLYRNDETQYGWVRERLRVYRERTEPLVERDRRAGLLRDVDATGAVDAVEEPVLDCPCAYVAGGDAELGQEPVDDVRRPLPGDCGGGCCPGRCPLGLDLGVDAGGVRFDYRPVQLETGTSEVEKIPPQVRAY